MNVAWWSRNKYLTHLWICWVYKCNHHRQLQSHLISQLGLLSSVTHQYFVWWGGAYRSHAPNWSLTPIPSLHITCVWDRARFTFRQGWSWHHTSCPKQTRTSFQHLIQNISWVCVGRCRSQIRSITSLSESVHNGGRPRTRDWVVCQGKEKN